MILNFEKVCEFPEMRDFVVVKGESPNLYFVGGASLHGVLRPLSVFDLDAQSILPLPFADDSPLHEKLKRIGHNVVAHEGYLYVLGGHVPYQSSLIKIKEETWTYEEKILEHEFQFHSFEYCPQLNELIVFNGVKVFFFSMDFVQLRTVEYEFGKRQLENRYTMTPIGPWLYIFGGHNGLSYGKRFFRFHLHEHYFESLPTIPYCSQLRLMGATMHCLDAYLFFVFTFSSISRFNFFYIFDTEQNEWKNFYVVNYLEKCHVVNIHEQNRFLSQMKGGMKLYHSLLIQNEIYILTGGSLFFHYPNDIFRIRISNLNSPKPTDLFNTFTNFDFTIQVQNRSIYCHRHMLSKFSKYFQNLFESSHFEESGASNVDFEEMSYDILFELIRYMYNYPHSSFDMCIVQKDFNLLVSTAEYFMMDCFLHDLENYVLLHFAYFSSPWINKNKISFHHMPRLDTVFKKNHAAK